MSKRVVKGKLVGPYLLSTAWAFAALVSVLTPTAAVGAAGAPLNDSCSLATVVQAVPFSDREDTRDTTSTRSDPVPPCGRGRSLKSVFYTLTPRSDGFITADTFKSTFDTVVSVYTGQCGALSPVIGACNDDAAAPVKSRESEVSFTATAGTTYFFMISAYANDGGDLVFNVTDPDGTLAATQGGSIALDSCALDPRPGNSHRNGVIPLGAVAAAACALWRRFHKGLAPQ